MIVIKVCAGCDGALVFYMQDSQDGYVGNPDITGDSPFTGTGIVMYLIQYWLHFFAFLLFLHVPVRSRGRIRCRVVWCKHAKMAWQGISPLELRCLFNNCVARSLKLAAPYACYISDSSAFM
ncbi:hypothetical protein TNCV_1782441 [Trichonephila clavipes]|nr:hypothetical protein TNCV_1782441 [Trichonephila clavipes]